MTVKENEEEWEDYNSHTNAEFKLKTREDRECCLKYCCIDFKKDCWTGTRRSLVQAFIKLTAICIATIIIICVYYRAHSIEKELILATWQPSTRAKPAPGKIYSANWNDLETRLVPSWYDRAKIGIHINWGIYSAIGYGPESEMSENNMDFQKFANRTNGPTLNYRDLVHNFTAIFFNPDYWAKLFAKSGAKYVIITSKDHDGYAMFPSDQADGWNTVVSGPRRDIVGELATAIRQQNMKFGVFYSAFEWHSPLLMQDTMQNNNTKIYQEKKLKPDLKKLIFSYIPSLLYMSEMDPSYIDVSNLLAWLFNYNPLGDELVFVAGSQISRSCFGTFHFPQAWYKPGKEKTQKWEQLIKLDRESVGYRYNLELSDIISTKEMLFAIISTIARGGNAAINVSPTKEGIIPMLYQTRLLKLGKWLQTNGEAVYGTMPWKEPIDEINSQVFYTCTATKYIDRNKYDSLIVPWKPAAKDMERRLPYVMKSLYGVFFHWPSNGSLRLRYVAYLFVNDAFRVEFLEQASKYLNYTVLENGMYKEVEIQLPSRATVISKHAWVLKITRNPIHDVAKESVNHP